MAAEPGPAIVDSRSQKLLDGAGNSNSGSTALVVGQRSCTNNTTVFTYNGLNHSGARNF